MPHSLWALGSAQRALPTSIVTSTQSVAAATVHANKMSHLMEELLQSSNVENLNEGSIIKGTIIEIRPTEVVVDIGGKSEGIIHAN